MGCLPLIFVSWRKQIVLTKLAKILIFHSTHKNRVPPDVGLAPSAAWSPPPPTPRTPPPHQLGPPPPGALQKEPRGVGGRGKERAGRKGGWLEGRVLQLQWGMGGTLQTPVGARPTSGAPKNKKKRFCSSQPGNRRT